LDLYSYIGQEQFTDSADIRAIINDDATLMQHILPSLRAYNLSQLLVVEHPATDGIKEHTVSSPSFLVLCPQCARRRAADDVQSLLSFAGIVPGEEQERFVDHEGKRSFVYDHINAVCFTDSNPSTLLFCFGFWWTLQMWVCG
jgi:hypothetical protein